MQAMPRSACPQICLSAFFHSIRVLPWLATLQDLLPVFSFHRPPGLHRLRISHEDPSYPCTCLLSQPGPAIRISLLYVPLGSTRSSIDGPLPHLGPLHQHQVQGLHGPWLFGVLHRPHLHPIVRQQSWAGSHAFLFWRMEPAWLLFCFVVLDW